MDFTVIIYSMLYRSTSLFLINVHTLCHLIISDWKNTIVLLMSSLLRNKKKKKIPLRQLRCM